MSAVHAEISERFGANLRRRRRSLDLSQERLGQLASLHRTAIGMLEQGERMPRIDTLVKLAASLEASPSDLLKGIEWLPARDRAEGTFRIPGPFEDRWGAGDG
jgi:transcriptional regulator with XRE-family HTH domain